MENRALAHRYAKALSQTDPEGTIENDVQLLNDSIHRSRHVIMVFLDPMVLGKIKLNAIYKAYGPMPQKLVDFLEFVNSKNRLDHLPLILTMYLSHRHFVRGLAHGHVISAMAMPPEQIRHLEKVVGEKIGKTCEFTSSIDSRLIGGFTIHIHDTVYDCSVRNQLNSIRSRFLNLAG